jgi:hypothetical protein
MSKIEKIRKLSNAIRRFRGLSQNGKFIHAPQSNAAIDVVKWLDRLGHPAEIIRGEIQLIAGFKKITEFEAWIRELEKPDPLSTAAVMGGAA